MCVGNLVHINSFNILQDPHMYVFPVFRKVAATALNIKVHFDLNISPYVICLYIYIFYI